MFALQHEFHAQIPWLDKQIDGELVLSQVRVGLAPESLDDGILTAQKLNKIVQEAGNHVGFVELAGGIDVDTSGIETKAQPRLDRVERNHPEDPDDVLLHIWHVPVCQVKVDQSHRQNDSAYHHHLGRVKRGIVDPSLVCGLDNNDWNDDEHGRQCDVPEQMADFSERILYIVQEGSAFSFVRRCLWYKTRGQVVVDELDRVVSVKLRIGVGYSQKGHGRQRLFVVVVAVAGRVAIAVAFVAHDCCSVSLLLLLLLLVVMVMVIVLLQSID